MIVLLQRFLAAILAVTLAIPLSAIANDPSGMNGSVSYTYDPVGNRTQKVSTLPGYPGGLSNYNANDQLATDTYDNDGNTTASNGVGYVYDFENHLVQAGAGISYVYDGDGNRVSKTVAGVTTTYVVDTFNPTGYAQVVTEKVSGTSPQSYVYGLERIGHFWQFYDSTRGWVNENVYFVYDGHGSVRALTDATGTVTDTYDYDAFGNLIHSTGTTPNNYLFSGEQFDPDLGLYYNRARYLNVSTGRFWSMDAREGTDEIPLSLQKYLYSNADPVNGADPTGREDVSEAIGGFGVSNTINAAPILNYRPFQYQYRIASTISSRGIEFIRLQETYEQFPYDHDGGQNCTIGYGHLIRRAPCTPQDDTNYPNGITRDAAEQLLFQDIYLKAVFPIKFLVTVPLAQKEFDALTDFTFNLGAGDSLKALEAHKGLASTTLLRVLNLGFYSAVPAEFRRFIYSNGKPAGGLIKRRNDEALLWSTGIYHVTTAGVTIP